MSSRLRPRTGALSSSRTIFITALIILGAAIFSGLVVLAWGAIQSAVLVDSLPAENTVRTPELGAAWNIMLLGLEFCAASATAAIALVLSSRHRAG